MGILNLTPDSFSDGGKFQHENLAVERAKFMQASGADIIDLGAESTRPGAEKVSENDELSRLLPIVERLVQECRVPLSIDTTKPRVARECLKAGAHIINDASGFRDDPRMVKVVQDFGAGVVIMHRRGTPKTMMSMAEYGDVVKEVSQEISQSVEIAKANGISMEQITIDPGLGFAKTPDHCLEILNRLEEFKSFGRPIVLGPSRKSFIGAVTKQKPEQRLHGTIAACVLGFERGAGIFRVHDAWAAKEALLIAEAVRKQTTELGPSTPVPGLDELSAWLLGA